MFDYSDVAIKLVVGFIFMTVLINFTGKGNLAPTSAIDQVQNYVLGESSVGSFTTVQLR